MVGTKTIFRFALRTFSMACSFCSHSESAARAAVDVVAHAVELQVEGVQAGFLGLLREFQVGELQAVGGHLQVREAHVARHAQHIEEARIDGRLAAGELHDAAGHRLFVAQRLQHAADLFEIRLVDVARRHWRWRSTPGR